MAVNADKPTYQGEQRYDTSFGTAGGYNATKTFYAAATSGGAVTTLNTVIIAAGLITSWTQTTTGSAGEWHFNDSVNSGQILTIGF